MSATDDAQDTVDRLEGLHTSLMRAWIRASNAGDFDTARDLKAQADRAGDQLIDARQRLLAAIDSGEDVTDLLAMMDGLAARIARERKRVDAQVATANEVAGVLDTVGQVVALAKQIAGAV